MKHPKKLRYIQLQDGDQIKIPWKKGIIKFCCCDCNLVHFLGFEVKGPLILMKTVRATHSTAQRRRYMRNTGNRCIGCMAKYRTKNRYPPCVRKGVCPYGP